VVLTGIAEVASRGDLIDRASVVTLKPISTGDRKTEAELEARWRDLQPFALGGLLDATVVALRRLPETRPEHLPRLAEHARFVMAAEPGLGWPDGTYLRVYDRSRSEAFEAALDASPITGRLRVLAGAGFDGTPTELHERLAKGVDESVTRRSAWPANARALSAELRRLAPSLREAGIEIDFKDTARPRRIVLRTAPKSTDGSDEKDPADASDANQHDPSGGPHGTITWPSGMVETW
jgi:putative DNA primase/helicase